MGKTCVPCRTRKVKCDGKFPQCTPCYKYRYAVNCTYERSPWGKDTLRKREACLPCRRSKRRCDADRPSCSTCQSSRKGGECVYDKTSPGRHHQRDSAGNQHEIRLTSRNLSSLDRSRKSAPMSSRQVMTLSPTTTATGSFTLGNPQHDNFHSFFINPSRSFYNIRSDSLYSAIIFNPSLPLKLQEIGGPSAFALSDISLDDLNMKFRILFLYNRFLCGTYLSLSKQQAILLGDTSSDVIHPFFIHFAHLAGCQIYQERQGYFCLLHIQAVHLQSTLMALGSMREDDDPLSLALAYYFLGMAHGYVQNVQSSKRCIRRSVEIIRRNNIRFVPISTGDAVQQVPRVLSPLEVSEEICERAAFLAQMLYSEMFFFIAVQPGGGGFFFGDELKSELPRMYSDIYVNFAGGQPEERSFDLEMQFRYELPDVYPMLFEICPVLLRARSMILAKDCGNLIAWFHQEAPSVSWFSTCSIFLSHLMTHIKSLDTQTATSAYQGNREMCWVLRYASILSLTTLAQITHTLAKHPQASSPTEFREKCSEALRRVVTVVRELTPDEFQFLDPFLGIYWSRTLALLTNSNERPPFTETTSAATISSNSVSTLWSPHPVPYMNNNSPTSFPITSDLEANIQLISQLNDRFMKNRFLPGTTSLCKMLAAQNIRARPGSPYNGGRSQEKYFSGHNKPI